MRAFKENPVFFSLTALLLLCSVVFSILSLLALGKKSGNRDDFDKSQRDLKRLITSKPYPTGGILKNQSSTLRVCRMPCRITRASSSQKVFSI